MKLPPKLLKLIKGRTLTVIVVVAASVLGASTCLPAFQTSTSGHNPPPLDD
jgi:hypothetical protein